jgi:DNA repair protein RecO (recombination protein O)
MTRNLNYSALILKTGRSGEANRDVRLLTAEAELLRATVFGGPKSRLRSDASPFHSGRAWVYHEPVKNTYKLSDFDVSSWRPGLRELYERVMAADAVAHAILESHGGGGNWPRALSLAEAALDALCDADCDTCTRILLWFLWQWAGFLGIAPDLNHCSVCGKTGVMRLNYSQGEGGMVCGACAKPGSVLNDAGPGCRHWLETVEPLSPMLLNRYTLDKKSLNETQSLLTVILSEALGKFPAGVLEY